MSQCLTQEIEQIDDYLTDLAKDLIYSINDNDQVEQQLIRETIDFKLDQRNRMTRSLRNHANRLTLTKHPLFG